MPADHGASAASDQELVAAAKRGDKAAFHVLVDRYADYLHRLAVSLVGNSADAEDVVQETFAGAFLGMRRFRGEASAKTWLTQILVRQAAKMRRYRKLRRMLSMGWGGSVGAGEEDRSMLVESAAGRADARLDVAAILKTLSAEHAEVIVLRELEQLSYDQIAEALQVPRGTVESRLHRARAELRRRFEEFL